MTLTPGTRIGSYEVTSLVGSGGMGRVYRARDLKLGRDVAIKVLREEMASDPERLRRFEQEARAASGLNHPNIIHIYDIGKDGSTPYIAMEYVEGKTLREILSEGPLSTKRLLHIGTQIADGLAKAHAAGIIHRDLKPENIMVTSDGFVKILDFGLAKLVVPDRGVDSEAATLARGATTPGAVMGTVGYMSPEQAKGLTVDFRSDQFALGAILYEMATGKRAFRGDTAVETLSAIIKEEPIPLASLNPSTPSHLRVIAERCLVKEPQDRYDSTRDLARELKSVEQVSTTTSAKPEPISAAPAEARRPGPRLVVLPLENLSGDPEQEFFVDGMTEALITDLAKIRSLKVISRTSAMRYKGTDRLLPDIARELSVDAVIEGSALRVGDRVRITAQLIHAETDQHLWAESYERDLSDVLRLQSEVARAISQEIRVQLTPEERERLAAARTVIPEAHEAYLMGRHHWNKFTKEGFQSAVASFQKSIEIDPSYAPAHAGLANSYSASAFWGFARRRDVQSQAKAAVLRALELDDTLAEAHNVMASIRFWHDWDWDAGTDFEKAIELNPGDALARYWYGEYLLFMGRTEDGVEQITRAKELDPLSPLIDFGFAVMLGDLKRFDESIQELQRALELEPNFLPAHFSLAERYGAQGRYEDSLTESKRFWELLGHREVAEALEKGFAESGYKGARLAAGEKAAERWEVCYIPPMYIANYYLGAGELDKCFQWLDVAYEERDGFLLRIKIYEELIRSDPRYQDLLRRMNFPG